MSFFLVAILPTVDLLLVKDKWTTFISQIYRSTKYSLSPSLFCIEQGRNIIFFDIS